MVILASLAPLTLSAQSKLPRTPDGKPDLQGIWDFRTITPLERPNQFAGKDTLSADEVEALEQRTAETRVDRAPRTGDPGTYVYDTIGPWEPDGLDVELTVTIHDDNTFSWSDADP